jgi:glycosyltransferase involved in cell wall biosynthesis
MAINKILTSVIIPVYNCEKYLAEAIESVLSQQHHPLEILIIDDGSTDNSAHIARQYSSLVQYHYQSNQGTAAARNYGMQLAQGDLFAFLDADDLWLPNKLDRQISALLNNPQIEAVFTHACESTNPNQIDLNTAIPGYLPSTMTIDRVAMNRIGKFSDCCQVEWADWYIRSKAASLSTLMLPDLLVIRRLHSANKGIMNQQKAMTEYIHLLKAHIDRTKLIVDRHKQEDYQLEVVN